MRSAALSEWFEPRRAAYPWRGERDPYRVLVSEVMLQQTQAARVVPHYLAFLARFPSVIELATARRDAVVRAWAGLGYNRRAVALSEAAKAIVRDHDGRVPDDPVVLRTLPGIGPYTAAAVASIAFGRRETAIDTNVRRIVARVRLGAEPDDVPPIALGAAADTWLDRGDPGAWNQALMDLGREICRPAPRCGACPVARMCRSRRRFPTAGRGTARPSEPFEGSTRQLRGLIVAALRERPSLSAADLVERSGRAPEAVADAVAGLVRDGIVTAGPRIRLAVG